MYNTNVIILFITFKEVDGCMENLYTPSLTGNDVEKTKSFEVSNLFFVAIIGGILAVSVLGIRNAKSLKLEKKYIQLLTVISIILFISKIVLVYLISQQIIAIDDTFIKLVGRLTGAVGFFIFFAFLNKPYKEHIAVGGDTEPLMGSGLTWCILAGLIDALILAFILAM